LPDRIATLSPEEVSRFLARHRRHETLERYEPRLDNFLREILSKADEFVPSEAGAIMLDDPQIKMQRGDRGQLTYIAAFGPRAAALLGTSVPCDEGPVATAYTAAQSICTTTGLEPGVRSMLAVPVLVGYSVCGVLQLTNRLAAAEFTSENRTLIEIFAGYISSSLQNALDAIRAREAARRDHLTGLFNERYFHYRLREEIRKSAAAGDAVTLLFIDLDNFKQVNDRFGHLAGSRTLHEVGLLLAAECPAGSIVARYGGDEFVSILPGCEIDAAIEIARALRARIAAESFVEEDPAHRVTVSVGVACSREHLGDGGTAAEQTNRLILLADSAMYRAKANGKDRIERATADDAAPREEHT
jgi:diguanylate cyclase (GGDEF)-like protein